MLGELYSEQARLLLWTVILITNKWTANALVFSWGDVRFTEALWGPEELKHDTRMVVLSRLPNSLFLFGIANFIAFFVSVFSALTLTRRLGGWADRLFIALTPITSAPAWIYGVIFTVPFATTTAAIQRWGMPTDNWRLQQFILESQTIGEIIIQFLRVFALPAFSIHRYQFCDDADHLLAGPAGFRIFF